MIAVVIVFIFVKTMVVAFGTAFGCPRFCSCVDRLAMTMIVFIEIEIEIEIERRQRPHRSEAPQLFLL